MKRSLSVNKTFDRRSTYFIYDEHDYDFELFYSGLSSEQKVVVIQCGGYVDSDYVSFNSAYDAIRCCNLLSVML